MGKVVITQDQADRINYFRKDDERKGDAIRYQINKWLAPVNTCLNELTLDELARALYVGYEVEVEEQEPQFEVGDWAIHDRGIPFEISEFQLANLGKLNNLRDYRHATGAEIAVGENRRMNKKINEIWIGLSDYERNGFYRKLVRGEY